jgi:D-glycero-alpha-D-manno-heptose-7-phosphate kinase
MLQLVDEAEGILVNLNRPIEEIGKLMHESWKIKRSLTGKISNASIDEIYDAGLSAGAIGGKLLGAGGGGFMLFFVSPEKREALRLRLKKLLCVPFSFSTRGSDVIAYEPEEEYDQSLSNERAFVYGQKET